MCQHKRGVLLEVYSALLLNALIIPGLIQVREFLGAGKQIIW